MKPFAYSAATAAICLLFYIAAYYAMIERSLASIDPATGELSVVRELDILGIVAHDVNTCVAADFERVGERVGERGGEPSPDAPRRLPDVARPRTIHGHAPTYRIAGSVLETVFAPMFSIDRRLRRTYWAECLIRPPF